MPRLLACNPCPPSSDGSSEFCDGAERSRAAARRKAAPAKQEVRSGFGVGGTAYTADDTLLRHSDLVLSIYYYIYLSICLSIYLSIYLSI